MIQPAFFSYSITFNYFPADSPAAVGEVVAEDFEGPYLRGV